MRSESSLMTTCYAKHEDTAEDAPFSAPKPDQNMKRRMLTFISRPTPIMVVTMLVPP